MHRDLRHMISAAVGASLTFAVATALASTGGAGGVAGADGGTGLPWSSGGFAGAAGHAAVNSGGAGGAGGAYSVSPPPTCEEYCTVMGAECDQYASSASCLASCAILQNAPATESQQECRMRAAESEWQSCLDAGLKGGCYGKDDCATYCTLMAEACPNTFIDPVSCLVACEEYPGLKYDIYDAVTFQNGDTFQCRLYHASLATADPAACSDALPASSVCSGLVQMPSESTEDGYVSLGDDVSTDVWDPSDPATSAESEPRNSPASGSCAVQPAAASAPVLLGFGALGLLFGIRRRRPR